MHPIVPRLKNFLKENKLTKKQISHMCGFNVYYINLILSNKIDHRITLSKLLTISEIIGIRYLDL